MINILPSYGKKVTKANFSLFWTTAFQFCFGKWSAVIVWTTFRAFLYRNITQSTVENFQILWPEKVWKNFVELECIFTLYSEWECRIKVFSEVGMVICETRDRGVQRPQSQVLHPLRNLLRQERDRVGQFCHILPLWNFDLPPQIFCPRYGPTNFRRQNWSNSHPLLPSLDKANLNILIRGNRLPQPTFMLWGSYPRVTAHIHSCTYVGE